MLTLADKALTKIMLDAGMIDESEYAEIMRQIESSEKPDLDEILVNGGYITPRELELVRRSMELDIPCVSLKNVTEEDKDEEAVSKILPSFALRRRVVPLQLSEDNVLKIAMPDLDLAVIDDIRLVTGCEVEPVLALEEEIQEAIRRFYGKTAKDVIDAEAPIGVDTTEGVQTIADYGLKPEDLATNPTVIHAVNQIIIDAVREKASDIHIEPFENEVLIRYRIDGVLERRPSPPKYLQHAITSRVKLLAKMNIAERRRPQDGRIQLRIESLGNREIDIRVSTVPVLWGESVVMRILDKEAMAYDLESLGLLEDNLQQFYQLISKPYGIILSTGPTGSGKTTTLYACLKKINTEQVKIITIEEPVEYDLEGINQIEVRPEIGVTFAAGLRHILRQDPDIIMVGEIRDLETAEMAIHASLTGHLVFSTLHTNDAASAITRLIDMGIEPFLVASTLEGIVAQRLVRKVCKSCAQRYHPTEEELRSMGVDPETVPDDLMIYRAVRGADCDECRGRGYVGRTGIFEVIVMNDQLRQMAMENVPSQQIKQEARKYGMRTLREDGWRKVVMGITTIEEVMRITQSEAYEGV
ncbi:Flp pilus assembly complex ATPase component TadA [Candidatus Poribacteria bacterium]|nr:Flp pilus assembly complex ATPase component TadA [Candidatus Poribacteria bacterium]